MFLATLTLASASVFGMDSVPDTGSERKRIQNSEVAPNQKKASMEEEFSELMEAVKSNNLNKVCKIIENHPDKSKIRDLLLYGKNKARLSKDQLEQVRRELYQNSYVTELVNLSDKNGIFPLFVAVQNGYEEIAKYLIDHGADVNNIANIYRQTPLFWAVQFRHETIAKYLIDHGADVNIADKSGNTPLFWAVRQNNSEKKEKYEKIIEILKAAGAK